MKKKVLILYFIFCTLLVGTIIYSVRDIVVKESDLKLSEEYGLRYNSVRSAYDIPPIEKNWIAHETDSSHIFWSNVQRKVDKTEPFHLYKTTYLRGGSIYNEKDAFHYETNGDTAYRLMVFSYFDDQGIDSVRFKLIIYFKNQYPPSESKMITKEKADSVMSHWTQLNKSLILK